MLREILRTSLQQILRRLRREPAPQAIYPAEELRALKELHERAPVDFHTRILYGDIQIGAMRLLDLFNHCVRGSDTQVSPWKTFIRIQGAANLARYFLHSLTLDGSRAECGVFQGFSALFVCRAAALTGGRFSGADFHLIDSFEGFPKPRQEDFIPIRLGADKAGHAPAFREGDGAASLEQVRHVFRDFPDVRFHAGYIPRVFDRLPETRWAFVHIDVDLHEPTLASLEYFHPRMVRGGIIICDDYGSKLFPGARKAWDAYCEGNAIPFVVLETGQSVLMC
jgi:O-methyltransferase